MASVATLLVLIVLLITAFVDINSRNALLMVRGFAALVLAVLIILGRVGGF